MLFQEKTGVRAIRLALSLLAGSVAVINPSMAQEVQKVEITGSSIKRIAVEGALPIQVISKEAIAKSGAVSVAELIQALPAMQGFTISAIAAGSDSGGRVSASIHGIGEAYTLVLLNGRRIAPQGDGSTVNLNAIPMSAVERVEVLSDGASALYGSDAIAGVVNFVLKKNLKGGSLEATYNSPMTSGGGKAWNVNMSYGYGDLNVDNFNVLLAYRRDEQTQLKATDREFAKSAYVPFTKGGKNYVYDRTSAATIPANVAVSFNAASKLPATTFSPYLKKNGSCPERNFASLTTAGACAFDFAATVEIVPESVRDSFFGKATYKLNKDVNLFAETVLGRYDLTARIAPNVAPFSIPLTSAFYTENVLPHLTPAQAAAATRVSGNYRTYDWGTRDSQTITDTKHLVLGGEMEWNGWSMASGLTWSQNAIDEKYVGGYVLAKEFNDMLTNRSFDPFAPIGAQSEATKALIKNSLFNGSVRTASTTLKAIDFRASGEVFKLPGGAANIGLGLDYRQYRYEQKPSLAAASDLIYNYAAPPEYDLKRNNTGLFAELLAPITKELEVTTALRYDSISAIENGVANRTMGSKQSASTYKVSARYQPNKTLLFRGAYGTGFKAPDMLDIGQPLVLNGVTASNYSCPFPSNTPDYCRPAAKAQYDQFSGGNENLKPEKSKQFSIGFRVEPNASFSAGMDLWDVKITDAVKAVTEQSAFEKPLEYKDLFTTYTQPATGDTYWAFKRLSINIGKAHNRGIDWDLTGRHKFDFGTLTLSANGTYMLIADYTVPGKANEFTSSMNAYGVDNQVTFRNIVKLAATLENGAWSNTLTLNYRNGYTDAPATVRDLSTGANINLVANGVGDFAPIQVPSYTTLDWQGRYMLNKQLTLRAGIKNVLNRKPPLSLRASSGHQVGFDPRYTDPMMRSLYLTANYQF